MTRQADSFDATSRYGARYGRGWDFAGQPGMAELVVEMYDATPPIDGTEQRHHEVAKAFLTPPVAAAPIKVTLHRIRLDRGGYDSGGAYWGCGQRLYFAGTDDGSIDIYFRAPDRETAKMYLRDKYPAARFYR